MPENTNPVEKRKIKSTKFVYRRSFCDSIKRRMEDGGSRGAPIGSGKCTRKKEEEVV